MGLDGIAGRQLLGRLAVPRTKEKDRAAANDNRERPVSLAQANREAEKPAREEDRAHRPIL